MRILYLINFAGKAGTEKYVKNLIEAYNGKKAECYFAYSVPGKLSEDLSAMNIPSLQFKMKFPFDLSAAKTLASYCRENKIDVICPQYPRENVIAVLSKMFYDVPKVVFTSHLTISCNLAWRTINHIITPYNHKIISVCSHGKKLLIGNGAAKDKIEVVYNAIELDTKNCKNNAIRKEINASDDEFILSIMARYHSSKGLSYLIESINELKKIAVRPFRLLIMGDGEEWDLISKLIKKNGLEKNVLQLGFRSDCDSILSGSDIYINSSSCLEALSFAILEALSKGLPVVATDAGGNPDIVNSDTDCGILVRYGDSKQMANAINSLINDPDMYSRMSKNAKKAIEGKFNYQTMLDRTFECYL